MKAFDPVKRNIIWTTLRRLGISDNQPKKCKTVKWYNLSEPVEPVEVKLGVRQRRVLSQTHFLVCWMNQVIRDIARREARGIS